MTAVSVLLLFLPVAALIALVLAWPLARWLPRRRVFGWILVAIGLGGYIWFSAGPMPALVAALAVAAVGFGFVRGHSMRATQ